jgi:zinc protease
LGLSLIKKQPIYFEKLNNGLTLLIMHDPSASVVAFNIWVKAGSIDEKKDERGMAHLIEHMIFKGTKKRKVGEISKQVEAAGGYLNAFTSFEHTCFYVVLPANQIYTAIDIQLDAYLNPTFDQVELDKEKEVVFEEMSMRMDDPWSQSWEILFDKAFRRNPYHWPVIGDKKILKKIPRERLIQYYKKHYVPQNTVISIVGPVDSSKVSSHIKKHLNKVYRPTPPDRKILFDSIPQKLKVKTIASDVNQMYVSLGFPTVPISHEDTPALEILTSILSDGGSSRLNFSIREQSKSADEIGCELFCGNYGGLLVIQALTDLTRLEKLLKDIMIEIQKIQKSGIELKELEKFKTRLRASKIFEKQSVDGQAKSLGFWQLQGDYQKEKIFLDQLNQVQCSDIINVCKKYIHPSMGTLVILHPQNTSINSNPQYWENLLKINFAEVQNNLKNSHEIQTINLKNQVLLIKNRMGVPAVSLGVFFRGGFSEEAESEFGITALMSKSILKGTKDKNFHVLSEAIENLGAHIDTFVEKDYWGMTLDTLTDQFEAAFSIFSEILLLPSFAHGEILKERHLQVSSINRISDDPEEYSFLLSDARTFSKSQYAHSLLGTSKTVSKISPNLVKEWYLKKFKNQNKLWVVVGDIEKNKIIKLIDETFKNMSIKKYNEKNSFDFNTNMELVHNEKINKQQANIVFGFQAPKFTSKDYFAFRILNALMNGMGAKLFVELREKKSLAYSTYAIHEALRDDGIYQIYIACALEKLKEAKVTIGSVIDQLHKGNISESELARAKTYAGGLYLIGLQSNRSQMLTYARYYLTGLGIQYVDDYVQNINKVTLLDIKKMAKKYLNLEKATCITLTPKM